MGVLHGFGVWPFDCDINFHLTNARYFALCDLSRIYYMGQVGVLLNMIKRKWLPVAQAQEITYLKPIKPFQRFEVLTRFSYWDNKYWYTEHKFIAGDLLCAVLQVRGVFVHGKKVGSSLDQVGKCPRHKRINRVPQGTLSSRGPSLACRRFTLSCSAIHLEGR